MISLNLGFFFSGMFVWYKMVVKMVGGVKFVSVVTQHP